MLQKYKKYTGEKVHGTHSRWSCIGALAYMAGRSATDTRCNRIPTASELARARVVIGGEQHWVATARVLLATKMCDMHGCGRGVGCTCGCWWMMAVVPSANDDYWARAATHTSYTRTGMWDR